PLSAPDREILLIPRLFQERRTDNAVVRPAGPANPRIWRMILAVVVAVGTLTATGSACAARSRLSVAPVVKAVARAASGLGPSGQAMPIGDLPGWRQVFADDFSADPSVRVGRFARCRRART